MVREYLHSLMAGNTKVSTKTTKRMALVALSGLMDTPTGVNFVMGAAWRGCVERRPREECGRAMGRRYKEGRHRDGRGVSSSEHRANHHAQGLHKNQRRGWQVQLYPRLQLQFRLQLCTCYSLLQLPLLQFSGSPRVE